MKHKLLLSLSLLAPLALPLMARAQNVGDAPIAIAPARPEAASLSVEEIRKLGQGVAFPYEILSRVLAKGVNKNGEVNYGFIKGDNDLDVFVRAVGLAQMDNFPVFKNKDENGKEVLDQRQPLAFYINAYNALFLQAVTAAYPVSNVSDIADLNTKKRLVAGEQISLDELRKKIVALDPRAIFVLMDGTRNGPRALQSAVLGYNLNIDLNAAIKAFVDDPTRVAPPSRIDNEVTVSPWLQSVDAYFKGNSARRKGDGIRALLAGYTSNGASQRYFGAGAYTIRYLPAQKGLNEPSNAFTNIGQGDLGGSGGG